MIYAKVKGQDKWVLKKKFLFAAVTLAGGTIIAAKGLWIADITADITILLSGYGTFSAMVLGIVFAADVADKKLNGGHYHDEGHDE